MPARKWRGRIPLSDKQRAGLLAPDRSAGAAVQQLVQQRPIGEYSNCLTDNKAAGRAMERFRTRCLGCTAPQGLEPLRPQTGEIHAGVLLGQPNHAPRTDHHFLRRTAHEARAERCLWIVNQSAA